MAYTSCILVRYLVTEETRKGPPPGTEYRTEYALLRVYSSVFHVGCGFQMTSHFDCETVFSVPVPAYLILTRWSPMEPWVLRVHTQPRLFNVRVAYFDMTGEDPFASSRMLDFMHRHNLMDQASSLFCMQ